MSQSEKKKSFYLYDLTELNRLSLEDPHQIRRIWDTVHLVTSLQGLVNREQPRLYIRYNATQDDFWCERLLESGSWFEGAEVNKIGSLEDLLDVFKKDWIGGVVYDERVPATSNVASTVAGLENLLCLRYDDAPGSLYQELVNEKALVSITKKLLSDDGSALFTGKGLVSGTNRLSTGSPKNDAYIWLIEHYMKSNQTNPRLFGYYIDAFWLKIGHVGEKQNHTLTNHDYIIANKGVMFDLNVWDDEASVDEPNLPDGLDVCTFREILDQANKQMVQPAMIHVAGFVPWLYKYTDCTRNGKSAVGKHGAVYTEWKYAEILTSYNAYMDADALGTASMVNASFFQHYPLPEVIPQKPIPMEADLRQSGYIDDNGEIVPRSYYTHYVGDYDSAAWLYWRLAEYWNDETRGQLPLSWAFNPNLADRFGFGMHWSRKTATNKDCFVTGDSGAGYVNPGNLSEPRPYSGYNSAIGIWIDHCQKYMQQWDLHHVGFIIDGSANTMTSEGWEAYSYIAPEGIMLQFSPKHHGVYGQMPFIVHQGDLPMDKAKLAAEMMIPHFNENQIGFFCFRSIVRPPRWYVELENELDQMGRKGAQLVDMPTLFSLIRYNEKKHLIRS
jgi:GxGYxYP putative glycoside hydrolase C-terminal domain/GxGYxYP_N 1st domain